MNIRRLAVVLMMVGAVTVACNGDGPTGTDVPDISTFVGDWIASAATVTSEAEPDSTLDLTLAGIATVAISIAGDSTYTFTQDVLALTITGSFIITGNNTFDLTNDDDPGDTLSGTFTLSNNDSRLSVTLPETSLHPDPTSIYNPGTLSATFNKQ